MPYFYFSYFLLKKTILMLLFLLKLWVQLLLPKSKVNFTSSFYLYLHFFFPNIKSLTLTSKVSFFYLWKLWRVSIHNSAIKYCYCFSSGLRSVDVVGLPHKYNQHCFSSFVGAMKSLGTSKCWAHCQIWISMYQGWNCLVTNIV